MRNALSSSTGNTLRSAQAERSTHLLQRLTDLTLALSGAATVDQVGVTIVHHGLAALEGDYGWFGSVDLANGVLVTRAHEGYAPGTIDPYFAISLDDPTLPATEVLRTGEPIFIESPEHRRRRYPQFHDMELHGSFVVVPIAAFEDAPAVLSFGFLEARTFSDDDRRYIGAVVEACAQALRRASLLEAEQRSRARSAHAARLLRAARRPRRPEGGPPCDGALRGDPYRSFRGRARA